MTNPVSLINTPIVLITGGTGFLGGDFAAQCILQKIPCYYLIRGTNYEEAIIRLRTHLAKFLPSHVSPNLSQFQIILGDLGALSSNVIKRLHRVTTVVNFAAVASFGKHSELYNTNLRNTEAFLASLRPLKSLKRVLHISTAFQCGITLPQDSSVCEGLNPSILSILNNTLPTPLAPTTTHAVPYTATKEYIEEKICTDLKDLPIVIVRPSIVIGCSKTGTVKSDCLYWIFRSIESTKAFTIPLSKTIDIVPVDFVTSSILALTNASTLKHTIYHISAGKTASTFGEILASIDPTLPKQYTQITPQDLKGSINYNSITLDEPAHYRVLQSALQQYSVFAELGYSFDNHNITEEFGTVPTPFAQYAHLCHLTSEPKSIWEQLQTDFRA